MVTGRKKAPIPLLTKPDGTFTTSLPEASALLLSSKFPHEALFDPSLLGLYHGVPCSVPKVTAGKISHIVKGLSNRRCPGPDNVNHEMLKLLHKIFPPLLPHLFIACITAGYFPTYEGRVVFIPKPGKDQCATDAYHPITLLLVLGKGLERVLKIHIDHHLNDN